MTVIHDIWLIAGVIEAVIGTLEVLNQGKLTTGELFLWRIPRVLLGPFALVARLFEGIRNLELTGNILWQEKAEMIEPSITNGVKQEKTELEGEFDGTDV